ncbi:MAG: electron transport complex subunit E [Gemmatimonadetes bacterium]|nr:electron transport complex subunit E [Gemmatimonadota bacterium]
MTQVPSPQDLAAHGHGAPAAEAGVKAAARGPRTTAREDLVRGIWQENPTLRQLLGLCPTLAVTNTVANSVAMGLATFVVLVGSSLLVSSLKRFIPNAVRLATFILIIATWVTIADMLLEAAVPEIHKALGAFVSLIVVNCIILARQEAFASRQPVGRSVLDAVGTGLGFIVALLLMGTLREVIGYGSLLGIPLFGPAYEPWVVMILPPGGFLTIGAILMGLAWVERRRAAKRQPAAPVARASVGRAA